MRTAKLLATLGLAVSTTALSVALAVADEFRMHGSGTVAKAVVTPNQAAIEAKSGVKLSVLVNGSGTGLNDVLAGRAEMAMISAPLELEAKAVNGDVSQFRVKEVGSAKINLIVHPSNTVKLTADQAKDIMTGKITNWKDVGGADSPILVVVEAPGQGTRSVVEHVFLKGGTLSANARVVKTINLVADIIKQAPNSIGYGNSSSITPAVSVVGGVNISQPLLLVTKGEPDATASKVIAAVVAQAK